MIKPKNAAFALILSLITIAPAEWQRVSGWFEDLKPVKQYVVAVAVAVFIVVCLAIVIVPIAWDWIQYLS